MFCCDICFDDYSEFELTKYTNPNCRHSCCLKCFFIYWNTGINRRKCHLCRADLEHALLVSVCFLHTQHIKTVITEGNKYFGIELSIISEATRIWPESDPITKLLRAEFYKNSYAYFTLLTKISSNIYRLIICFTKKSWDLVFSFVGLFTYFFQSLTMFLWWSFLSIQKNIFSQSIKNWCLCVSMSKHRLFTFKYICFIQSMIFDILKIV
jgi:hypothetical protein